LRDLLRRNRAAWVYEKGNGVCLRDEFTQEVKSLWAKVSGQYVDPSRVASRAAKAGGETKSNRIGLKTIGIVLVADLAVTATRLPLVTRTST
jgi:hypothetical protein